VKLRDDNDYDYDCDDDTNVRTLKYVVINFTVLVFAGTSPQCNIASDAIVSCCNKTGNTQCC
jgi:hypothetical protein